MIRDAGQHLHTVKFFTNGYTFQTFVAATLSVVIGAFEENFCSTDRFQASGPRPVVLPWNGSFLQLQ